MDRFLNAVVFPACRLIGRVRGRIEVRRLRRLAAYYDRMGYHVNVAYYDLAADAHDRIMELQR